INRRRDIAARYTEGLRSSGLSLPSENSGNRHVYYQYVVEHPQRDLILKRLIEDNIHCKVCYPFPIHTMRGYAYLGYSRGQFPIAEEKMKRVFSLPVFPHLSDMEVHRIIETLKRAV